MRNKQKQGTKHVQMFAQLKHVLVFLTVVRFAAFMNHLPVFEKTQCGANTSLDLSRQFDQKDYK